MGLSSLPAPSEGMLCVLLVNTALSLSIFKGLVRTILHIVGIELASTSSSLSLSQPQQLDYIETTQPDQCSYIEEFRSLIPTIRFSEDKGKGKEAEAECSVCLSEFEGESEINQLRCGHVFHKVCLDKWLDYNYNYCNITCPLCRTPLMPEQQHQQHISCFW